MTRTTMKKQNFEKKPVRPTLDFDAWLQLHTFAISHDLSLSMAVRYAVYCGELFERRHEDFSSEFDAGYELSLDDLEVCMGELARLQLEAKERKKERKYSEKKFASLVEDSLKSKITQQI